MVCGRKGGGVEGVLGVRSGSWFVSTQVINTLINSSAHIIIRTTGREWRGWNILTEFKQLSLVGLNLMEKGGKVLRGN